MTVATARETASILVVDDDERIRQICTTFLQKVGHEVIAAENAEEATTQAKETQFDVVLTDVRMPGMTGDVLIERLKKVRPELVAVIMTGYPSMELAIDAVGLGVHEFLTKPFKLAELQATIDKVLRRRAEEKERAQREFASSLVEMEGTLGDQFELQQAIEELLGATKSAADEEPSNGRAAATDLKRAAGEPVYIVVCEPIPSDRAALKTASNYHHFRTIYAAQRILNNLLQESDTPAEVKLVMANHSADIPKHFRRHADAVCCVIFGPNLPRLNEATVRIASNSHRQRQVVVCYNPDQVNFTWDQLEDLGTRMSITGCRAEADKNEIRQFWTRYFTEVLKPLVESQIESPDSEDRASADKQLTAEEIRDLLAKDPTAVDMLPGFPHICRQVIEAIDQGKAYAQVAEIIQPDGSLQASIVRTSNLARYASRNRIETLPNALTMIGMEETKRIVMGRAMSDLMKKIDQAGFDTRDFFCHSTCVGYLSQLLCLNLEAPTPKEREILQSLRLPNYVEAALEAHRCWELFPVAAEFDAFTAGILHDTGMILNTVCYGDIFPMVLYEYERSRWKGSLLQGEIAVVGDFQHPVSGGALLERWEVFPTLIEPIRQHHRLHPGGGPEALLLCAANILSKGIFPFPRTISITDEYRKAHLEPLESEDLLDNPLIGLFKGMTEPYTQLKSELTITPDEIDSGEYEPEHVEAFQSMAKQAVASEADAVSAFSEALVDQNPEFLEVMEQTGRTPEEFFALNLLLVDFVSERVNGLFQGTAVKR